MEGSNLYLPRQNKSAKWWTPVETIAQTKLIRQDRETVTGPAYMLLGDGS